MAFTLQLTNAGAALLNGNTGPITLTTCTLGSAYNYIPNLTDTNIHGSAVYSTAPSAPVAANANIVKYSVYLDYDVGSFSFGEFGLFTADGTLFALGANNALVQKTSIASNGVGNSIRLDIYLSMVSKNYDMWLDLAESNNSFRLAVLGSVDQLPSPQNAVPNAYIISGQNQSQGAYLAYTDRSGLWNFDAYAFAYQQTATITAFDSQSVTISSSQYVAGMNPAYLGEVVMEFATGALFGICRYVQSVVVSGGSATLTFDNPLMALPIVGDQVVFFGRQELSTTIGNLPIASSTLIGGVKVGTTLTIASDGTLNVAGTAYPVLSVNGKTGTVVLTAADISGLATVASTGSYNDLLNKPAAYVLPAATTTTLGGVMAPTDGTLLIAANGTLTLGHVYVQTVNGVAPDPSTGNVVYNPTITGLVSPAKIPNAASLNSYQTTGLFFILDADAPSITNAPSTLSSGGVLEVEPFTTTASGGDVIQRFQQANAQFFRRYTQSSNTWSAWTQVATSTALAPATTTTIGGVIVGAGLNVTVNGTLSTVIQSVNGQSVAAVNLTAADVGAITDAPSTGHVFGRANAAWVDLSTYTFDAGVY